MFFTHENLKEKSFKTKEQAYAVKECMQRMFNCTELKVKKSLPEFRGHLNKNWSIYYRPFSFAESIHIHKYFKTIE